MNNNSLKNNSMTKNKLRNCIWSSKNTRNRRITSENCRKRYQEHVKNLNFSDKKRFLLENDYAFLILKNFNKSVPLPPPYRDDIVLQVLDFIDYRIFVLKEAEKLGFENKNNNNNGYNFATSLFILEDFFKTGQAGKLYLKLKKYKKYLFNLIEEEKQDEEIRKLANAFNSFYILNNNNVSKNTVNRQKNKINRVLENTYLSRKNNMRPQNGGTKK